VIEIERLLLLDIEEWNEVNLAKPISSVSCSLALFGQGVFA
jgi:hypothetical protein